jgi:steroid 5-alpha reductase family enzyme
MLFIAGFFINQYHDHLLIQLRKSNGADYKIPFGGLFRFISCPNFFGEIIEWGGFALLTWCLPSFSFFLWTLVNLLPRAIDHHRWYKKTFADYPKNRKAIIPFLL